MQTIEIGIRAITRPKNSDENFSESRFLLNIPVGSDIFVYKNGVQYQSKEIIEAWHKMYGAREELLKFVLDPLVQ